MEVGLDLAGVAEEVAVKVVMGIARFWLQGEGEAGVGVVAHGFVSVISLFFEAMDNLFEEHFLEADFDLLGAEDAPGVGGELLGEEALVGGLGGEVGFETFF